jgi:hypothetical protein
MSVSRVPEVAAGRLDRHAKLLLLGLAAFAAAALLAAQVPNDATRYALKFAQTILFVALFLRIHRHWDHPVPLLRRGAVTAVFAGFAIIILPGLVGRIGTLSGQLAAVAALLCGWGAISLARRRWLAMPASRRQRSLSVAVICKDEADRIDRLLEAVHGWADEIVVLDSGSTDGTVEVAKRYTDKVESTDWPGYGAQKQRALERCSGDWVLSLDADEVPSEEFKREVDAWLDGAHAYDGFKAHWVSIVFGGPIDFGADGRYHTRLLRRAAARFDGAMVHEEAVIAGKVGMLEGPVYHFTFRDAGHMERKFDEYAWLSARSRFAKGRRATRLGAWVRGAVSFLLLYFVRLGVLDGGRGLRMAMRYARYTHDKYAFLRQLGQDRVV